MTTPTNAELAADMEMAAKLMDKFTGTSEFTSQMRLAAKRLRAADKLVNALKFIARSHRSAVEATTNYRMAEHASHTIDEYEKETQ